MIEIWYRGAMYKHLFGSIFGLALAVVAQGCCDEPESNFCSLENLPASEAWGLCTVDEQCPVGWACGPDVCAPSCAEDTDCGPSGFCSTLEPRVCILPCGEYPPEAFASATCTESPWAMGEPTRLVVDMCDHCGPEFCRWYDGS